MSPYWSIHKSLSILMGPFGPQLVVIGLFAFLLILSGFYVTFIVLMRSYESL